MNGPASVFFRAVFFGFVAYGIFPLTFARLRERSITKVKYYLICFGINFLVLAILFLLGKNAVYGGGYLAWTMVFSGFGVGKLRDGGILEEKKKPIDYSNVITYRPTEMMSSETQEESPTSDRPAETKTDE